MTEDTSTGPQLAEGIFHSDREELIKVALRIVESRAVAEELVQESWIRWHGRDYRAADARPIFRRIVSNLAKDWRRSRNAEFAALQEIHAISVSAPSSETTVIARAELLLVIRTLQKLPRRHVRAFRLRMIDGKTYREISDKLGLSLSHARNLVEDVIIEIALALDS